MDDNLIDLSVERQRRRARRSPPRCPECGALEDEEKELLDSGLTWGERLGLELEGDRGEALAAIGAEGEEGAEEDRDPATRPPAQSGDDDIPF